MIKLTQGSSNYRVDFRHLGRVDVRSAGKNTTPTRITICEVYKLNGEDKVFLAYGIARCHYRDNFCRNTGRKVALTNALKPFDKSFRKAVWEAYFESRNGAKE